MRRILCLVCLVFWMAMFGLLACHAETCDMKPILKGTWELTYITGYERTNGVAHEILFDDTFKGIKYKFMSNEIEMFNSENFCDCKIVKWSYNNGYITGILFELDAGDWVCYEQDNIYQMEVIKIDGQTLILRNFDNDSDHGFNFIMTFRKIN